MLTDSPGEPTKVQRLTWPLASGKRADLSETQGQGKVRVARWAILPSGVSFFVGPLGCDLLIFPLK